MYKFHSVYNCWVFFYFTELVTLYMGRSSICLLWYWLSISLNRFTHPLSSVLLSFLNVTSVPPLCGTHTIILAEMMIQLVGDDCHVSRWEPCGNEIIDNVCPVMF